VLQVHLVGVTTTEALVDLERRECRSTSEFAGTGALREPSNLSTGASLLKRRSDDCEYFRDSGPKKTTRRVGCLLLLWMLLWMLFVVVDGDATNDER
jgi:hypothetical protein